MGPEEARVRRTRDVRRVVSSNKTPMTSRRRDVPFHATQCEDGEVNEPYNYRKLIMLVSVIHVGRTVGQLLVNRKERKGEHHRNDGGC